MSDTTETQSIDDADPRVSVLLQRIELLETMVFTEREEPPEPDEGNAEGAASRDIDGAVRGLATQERKLEQFIDGLGLRHFKGSEFTPYWSRTRGSACNTVPPEETWEHIVKTLVVLDHLRDDLGSPIHLLSTYRAPDYNRAIGGEPNSWHMKFTAIDFTCAVGNPARWGEILKGYRGRRFRDPRSGSDFVFHGGIGIYPNRSFVHIDSRGTDADWNG